MNLPDPYKVLHDTWGITRLGPKPDDLCRLIWFASGKLRHYGARWKTVPRMHGEIWRWQEYGPEQLWIYNTRLRIWALSTFSVASGDTLLTDVLGVVPKDIELYNALLGD